MAQNAAPHVSMRVRVQKLGTFLSSMIMPNIGAFIAWGIITALFIEKGPFPNPHIASLVDPMVFYLLPILIAYSGGKLIYEHRGGVVGAVATMGVILGTSAEIFVGPTGAKSPMFLGAMIMGPLAAWCMKKLDALWAGKIKPGFEMLIDNFSAGIFAAIAAIGSMFLLTPVMNFISHLAKICVEFLVNHHLLPLTSILIEPAKILFLNNALNHGIITPLATQESLETGKSILFLLESNPGPGLGVLLAYMIFGSGSARATAPGAAIIHFLGGIHEIYFPYVLMKPQLVLAPIVGGMSGIFVESLFNAGLRSPAAPGSFIAILATTASDSYIGVIAGVFAATLMSFLVASLILKFSKKSDKDLAEASEEMQAMKGKKSLAAESLNRGEDRPIEKIVFACDAGMGSSAMGASVLRNKIKDAGFGDRVTVVNSAINNLKDEFDLLVSHKDLADRAATPTPSAIHVAVDNFMASPRYDEIVELIREQREGNAVAPASTETREEALASGASGAVADHRDEQPAQSSAHGSLKATTAPATPGSGILAKESIRLDVPASSRDAAIDEAGQLLVESGAVTAAYVDAMHERENSVSTFMGNGLAIPHGTNEAKSEIKTSAMSFVRYQEPVDWKGKPARFVIGIAGADGEHLELLQKVAKVFSDKKLVGELETAQTPEEILNVFGKVK